MIRYYCQYSYGGFKTFKINGEPHEALTQVVTTNESFGFPPLAGLYYDRGGVKILYRKVDTNTLALIIKEIPGPETDTDNRSISCAIQFIGDIADRPILDRLAIRIANNLRQFEQEFANMFDLRGGLHFDGDKLVAIVKECEPECSYKSYSELLDICKHSGTILLFVPFSDNIDKDDRVKAKLLSELQLPEKDLKESLIKLTRLEEIQGRIIINDVNDEKKTEEAFVLDVEKLQTEKAGLQEENKQLRRTIANATAELKSLKEDNSKRDKSSSILGIVLCVLLFVLALANCKVASAIILGLLLTGFSFKTYKLFKP